jgi:hypothetical protein
MTKEEKLEEGLEQPKTDSKKKWFARFMDHLTKNNWCMATGMFATLIIGVIIGQIGFS